MSANEVLLYIGGYFLLLIAISYLTSRKSDKSTFFTGNRKSPWWVVAYGMVGAALSGVTFVSLPGSVLSSGLHLGQFVLGNIVGYLVITFVLIPLYYKYQLVSIYGYIEKRFGRYSYLTSSALFLISQSFGAALRLLLALIVLDAIIGESLGIDLWIMAIILLALIYAYTFKSGIKTIVWTDLFQTTFLLVTVILVVVIIINKLDLSWADFVAQSSTFVNLEGTEQNLLRFFNWDFSSGNNFFWRFISGFLIAIAMMGLDQNMMQKSLTIAKVKNAQKNTLTFSLAVGIIQIFFLMVGALLYLYATETGVLGELPLQDGAIKTDKVFPHLAVNLQSFGKLASIFFVLGISAAAFSSADSALTALTTSFCYDFLKLDKKENISATKNWVHLGFSMVLLSIILALQDSGSNIFSLIFKIAGYTYSPLLAIFFLGILTSTKPRDSVAPFAAVLGILATWGMMVFLKSMGVDLGFMPILLGAINTLIFWFLLSFIFPKKMIN